jgi:hypothetical protein
MTPSTLYPNELSPQWVLWRELLSGDESRPLSLPVSTGYLRRKRQEEFVQTSLCKESAQQLWPTFNQH